MVFEVVFSPKLHFVTKSLLRTWCCEDMRVKRVPFLPPQVTQG